MKKELIKTPNYLLVLGDAGRQFAHLPLNGSPVLEGVPLLPPMEEDVWSVGLEAMLNELPYTKHLDDGMFNDGQVSGFELGAEWGYKKAREKYKFTEEDLKLAMNYGYVQGDTGFQGIANLDDLLDLILKKVNQQQRPTHFEFEMEEKFADGYTEDRVRRFYSSEIKTLTNSQGQIVACGKYIYEL